METFSINAETRPAGTKGDARKVRNAGSTPGNLYRAGEAAKAVAIDGKALSAIFRKTNNPNTIISVSLEGVLHPCLVREVQRNPLSRKVEHIDLLAVKAGERVSVRVAVTASGRAAGVRSGGQLRLLARAVNIECEAFSIPKVVDVDVTSLEIGRFIKASQLPTPEGVNIVFSQDFNVVTVEGKVKEVVEEAAADAKAAPGGKAAPAKGAAKAAPAKAAAKAAPAKK